MTLEDLILRFKTIRNLSSGDEEAIHSDMDEALLEYIDNEEVTRIFHLDEKWCA